MYLQNLSNLLSLLPIVPILAKDFFSRPKVQYETPETYPGQQGLGSTVIQDFLKTLSARFGGAGLRPSTYRGAESVRNFQPFEPISATGNTAFQTPNLGPLSSAIQRTMQSQTADREGRTTTTEPELTGTIQSKSPRQKREELGITERTDVVTSDPTDKVVQDILDQIDRRTYGQNE